MNLTAIILFASVLLLPVAGLLALRWAGRTGQFAHQDRAALLPFDETEPVGTATDQILGVRKNSPDATESRRNVESRNSLA